MKIVASNRSEVLSAAAAMISAFLLYASFAPLEWAWAPWVALTPILVVARRVPRRAAMKWAGVAGLLFWLGSLRWLTNVTITGWLALCAYCALYVIPAARWANRWRGGALGFATGTAVVWCGCEFIRGRLGGGFPWNPLAAGMTPWPVQVQLAELGGGGLVSGLAVFANGLLAWGVAEWPWRRREGLGIWRHWARWVGELAIGGGVVVAALVWGAWRLETLPTPNRVLCVALVQTAIPQDEKWVESKTQLIYTRLRTLTHRAQRDPWTELVLWPETALPDAVRHSERSYAVVRALCERGTPILLGSLDVATTADGRTEWFNSALWFGKDGALAGEYDKRHLVVFGESLPLVDRLPASWRAVLGLPPEAIAAGTHGTLFRAGVDRIPLAPLICFEDILPELARADVRNGARALANLTNDAWFDEVIAPRQHMRNAVLRAVENRVPLLRCANTGVTCLVGVSGRVEASLADSRGRTWKPGVLWTKAGVPADGMNLTLYTRFGDMYGMICAAMTVLWMVASLWHIHRVRRLGGI